MRQSRKVTLGAVGVGLLLATAVPALAQQLTNQSFQTNINIEIAPVAELTFQGGNLLYLEIPPSGSTIPGSGVEFIVTGNADATLIAEPDAFVLIGTQYMGKAVLNTGSVGYKLDLRFPDAGVPPPGVPTFPQFATLPGFEEGPTVPPLLVALSSTGQQRSGVLHMEAHPNWTPSGGIPLPGIYVGAVTLTLTASD